MANSKKIVYELLYKRFLDNLCVSKSFRVIIPYI